MILLNECIKNKTVKETNITKKLRIANYPEIYKVYDIPLDKLYYNDQNDRIATWISQYKTENNIEKFNKDDIEKYNNIIQDFIIKSNPKTLDDTQSNIELIGQQEPGVVLKDGRIIDGNRRFTCLRKIQEKTRAPQYFSAVILEKDLINNEKDIKTLELYLQHGVDKPIDYDPIDKLVGIYNDIIEKELLTVEEYADAVNKSSKEIEREMDKAKLMVEFLEFIGAPKQFYLAREMNINDPLKELNRILNKCNDEDEKEDIKNVVFANFIMRPFGDMTRYIRKIKKIVPESKVADQFIEEQLEYTKDVCDLIEKQSTINEKIINESIRTNKELQNKFEHSTNKWKSRLDSDSIKNRPAQQLAKVYDMLDDIDTNIFMKLTFNQKEDVIKNLNKVEEIINKIRGEINV